MTDILKETKKKIFYISPKRIKYCISPSIYCDYTQFRSTKIHPHAGIDRGVFREDIDGYIKINSSNWDKKGVHFTKLLEYEALHNHYTGKQNWKKSEFAKRMSYFAKNYHGIKRFKNFGKALSVREKELDRLINSIINRGVYVHGKNNKKLHIDNISVVLTRDNRLLFNNRGHHRLSIAKILKLKSIPVKVTVSKNKRILKTFLSENESKNC